MAQTPWTVVSTRTVGIQEASRLASRCAKDLSRNSIGVPDTQHLISNLTTLSQYLKHPRASSYKTEQTTSCQTNAVSAPVEDTNATFSCIIAKGTVQLHPCYLQSVSTGVRVFLSNFLLKYVPEFNGFWVAYHPKVQCNDSVGFSPTCGVLSRTCIASSEAVVQQIRSTQIALHVYGIFSACIPRSAGLATHYEYHEDAQQYIPKGEGGVPIQLKSHVLFKVKRYHTSSKTGELMFIEGSLDDPSCCGVVAHPPKALIEIKAELAHNPDVTSPPAFEVHRLAGDVTDPIDPDGSKSKTKKRKSDDGNHTAGLLSCSKNDHDLRESKAFSLLEKKSRKKKKLHLSFS